MKGYEKMHDSAQKLFNRVHTKHLAAMGNDMRKEYGLDQVKRVKQNNLEKCVEVYFKNGEMFKYYTNGTWG
ncbi:hypothetical protein F9U64_19145 [Gracilibacillus oryzae]|uniref:Uncharacterized protein n=1 Tax=Gracilibacillus oryzae TaxID=1672701 RepID=A0A7C8GRT2_9BACI|nr:hypothetical protein [Gracilibacillus oryzae]KAB8126935.1 hypothetical protein F9U64_19145 [Gracilibacillus oryzae]